MYEQHFGFSSPMFSDGLAQDDAVFHPDSYPRLLEDLEIALGRKDAVAVLSGPPGTGKSTLTGHALRTISTKLAFACISHTPLTAHELLEQLLFDFGFEPYKLSRAERLQSWRQFLFEMAATGTRVCILVESAESLSTPVLQALHSFTVADAMHCPGANLIITTSQDIDELLAPSELGALSQRARLRRKVAALTRHETAAYLAFKATTAGANAGLFADGVQDTIHALSHGTFRLIDNLLESSLRSAAAAGQMRLTPEIVSRIAAEQFGLGDVECPVKTEPSTPATAAPAANTIGDSRDLSVPSSEPLIDDVPLAHSPPSAPDHSLAGADMDAEPVDDRAEAAVASERETANAIHPAEAALAAVDIPTLDDPVSSESNADTDLYRVEFDAIATAERLEDLSRSMAETIFGDREFDDLVADMSRETLA